MDEPKFYAIDPLDAYPEAVGTLDKIEHSDGALWVHLNGKRSKLVGLQSLTFLIGQLEQIRAQVFGVGIAKLEAQSMGTLEPRTYADEPLSRIKAMGALVQDAKGINISGDTRKVSAFLLCGAAVPELVARIEELEAVGNE